MQYICTSLLRIKYKGEYKEEIIFRMISYFVKKEQNKPLVISCHEAVIDILLLSLVNLWKQKEKEKEESIT